MRVDNPEKSPQFSLDARVALNVDKRGNVNPVRYIRSGTPARLTMHPAEGPFVIELEHVSKRCAAGTEAVGDFSGVIKQHTTLVFVESSGCGPLTVKALKHGLVQLAGGDTADPSITANNFVVLDDPKAMILPQRVTPLVSRKITDAGAAAIAKVNAKLSSDALRQLNAASVNEKKKSSEIAKAWLTEQGLA